MFKMILSEIFFLISAEIRKPQVPDLPVVIRPRPTLHHNMRWLSKLQELPDVVFLPSPVTRPPAAENCGMIILWAWFTSGNREIAEKSDHRETRHPVI